MLRFTGRAFFMNVYATETRVVMDRSLFETILERELKLRSLVLGLRKRQLAEHDLLMVALHELASGAGVKDHAYFARRWLREHREQEAGWFSLTV